MLFLFSAVSVTAGNEAGVLPCFLVVVFFVFCFMWSVFTYACKLSIGFVLLCGGGVRQSSRKTSFYFIFFMLLILNSVLTTFTIERVFFPASTNAVFLFNYHTSINPALCFALHAGELLLSVMFVLL